MKDNNSSLNFFIAVSHPEKMSFQLDQAGADFSHNQVLLNTLIGTLVKYGQSGRIEPYLAESWAISEDAKTWSFKLRSGLVSQHGVEINAALFSAKLQQSLHSLAQKGSVMVFDQLEGWSDFIKNKADRIHGIKVSGNVLEFHFQYPPDSFLELLRMPYFGLWLYKDSQLDSTAAYEILKHAPSTVELQLRHHWFSARKNSIKNVQVQFSALDKVHEQELTKTILRLPFFVKTDHDSKTGYWIISPPTRLESFVLSPHKKNFFHQLENRKLFLSRIREKQMRDQKNTFFYPSTPSEISTSNKIIPKYKNLEKAEVLTFALERANYSKEEIQYFSSLIEYALKDSSIKFKILERDLKDQKWFEKTDSNRFFDARISSVDTGAAPLISSVNMMFCTKLGVQFPDPSKNICQLIQDSIKEHRSIDESFIQKFNQSLYDDAVVIPLMHHSDKWLVSNDIAPKSLPPTTLYPQFELIDLNP